MEGGPGGVLSGRKPADAWEEAADPGRVAGVRVAVGAQQVGLLDDPHLQLEGGARPTRPRIETQLGTSRVRPSAAGSIAAKIGLRTRAKGPLVTSSVLSSGSTPTRQLAPIATWAKKVAPIPARARTRPARWSARGVERGDRLDQAEQGEQRRRGADDDGDR